MIRFYGTAFFLIIVIFIVEASGKHYRKNNGNHNRNKGNTNGNHNRNNGNSNGHNNGNNGNGNGNHNGNNGIGNGNNGDGNGNHNGNNGNKKLPPMLPNSYKDVFVDSPGGKKTLGTTKATCWARGGICVNIRDCPHLNIDSSVPGCSWGYKVCCKVNKLGSPTVGQFRKSRVSKAIRRLEDLGEASLESLATRNTVILKAALEYQF